MLHITITRDGETVIDQETNGIIAVVNDEDRVQALSEMHKITGGDTLALIEGIDRVRDHLLQEHPELGLLRKLKELLKDKENKYEKDESESSRPSGIGALLDFLDSED